MKEVKEFNTIDEMYDYILSVWNSGRLPTFQKEDLSVSEDSFIDERIDWKECRYVCTKRFGENVYNVPQCIGYCSIE